MEWWLVTQYNLINITFQYSGAECQTQYCIYVQKVNGWGGINFGFSSSFLANAYKYVTLSVKLGQNSTFQNYNFTVGFDNCQNQSNIINVSNVWQHFMVDVSTMNCTSYIKIFRLNFNPGDNIYVDNIYLSNGTNGNVNSNYGYLIKPISLITIILIIFN